MKTVFRLDKNDYRRLQDRAHRSQQKDHSEVCGAILRTESNGIELSFLKNQGKRSGSFEIDKNDLKALRKKVLGRGKRVAGLFHSHPIGEAIPSRRDIIEAPIHSLMLLYDVCGREVRLYRVVGRLNNKSVRRLLLEIS